MRETIFTATLVFSLMAGGATAIGSEMLRARPAPTPATPVVTLPTVTVIGQRAAPTEVVVLPMVTVTARRATVTKLASETASREAARVE